jgi:hypothetical protein
MAREDGLVASECALGTARMKCDDECDQAKAVRQDYLARVHAFTASCQCSLDFDRVLEVCQFFLSV